jgi:hypothetical protein
MVASILTPSAIPSPFSPIAWMRQSITDVAGTERLLAGLVTE